MINKRAKKATSNKRSRSESKREVGSFLLGTDLEQDAKAKENIKSSLSDLSIDKRIKCKNVRQKELMKTIQDNEIIFVRGAAGTGKTFLTLKKSLELLKRQNNTFEQILLTKPIIEAQNNKLGFLPGGINEKIDPYMDSYLTNMEIIIGKTQTKMLYDNEVVNFNPLPYMRGATFMNSIAILDEAQNVTVGGLKLFISRKHETSKLIILGDEDQTDLVFKSHEKNGLQDAFERFEGMEGVGFVTFKEEDIVRSKILIEIMKRYKNI